MAMICDNPKCQHHILNSSRDLRFTRVLGPVTPNGTQQIIEVQRHLYKANFGREIILCDTCHSAAQLLLKGGAA